MKLLKFNNKKNHFSLSNLPFLLMHAQRDNSTCFCFCW